MTDKQFQLNIYHKDVNNPKPMMQVRCMVIGKIILRHRIAICVHKAIVNSFKHSVYFCSLCEKKINALRKWHDHNIVIIIEIIEVLQYTTVENYCCIGRGTGTSCQRLNSVAKNYSCPSTRFFYSSKTVEKTIKTRSTGEQQNLLWWDSR